MAKIVKGIRKYSPVWQDAKERSLNEADIVTRIVKFLEDVLEYDVLRHITKEFQVKDRYVDLAIKSKDKINYYIEVKSANTSLKEGQIFQAESYASQSGVEWIVLTNGSEWQLYHLTFDKTGIEHTLVFNIDLINGDPALNADKLYYLSYESIRKDDLKEYWDKFLSLHATSIIKALFHEETLSSIRKQIRRKTDIKLEEDEIVDGLKRLIDKEILSQYGDIIKIGRRRRINNKDMINSINSSETVENKTEISIEAEKEPVQSKETVTNSVGGAD